MNARRKPYLAPINSDEDGIGKARRIRIGDWSGRLMQVTIPDAHDNLWGTIEGLIFLVISEPEPRWSEYEMSHVEQVQIWARGVKRWWTLSFVSYQTDLLHDTP